MKIVFYGGKQAGMVALLTLLAQGQEIVCVVPIDEVVASVAEDLKLNVKKVNDVNDPQFVDYLNGLKPDLFFCCHGRQIIKEPLLALTQAINLHPCLYKYKGKDPVVRLLADGEKKASVGAHIMTKKVDDGEVLVEEFIETQGKTPAEVYSDLYPLYAIVTIKVLEKIKL